MSDWLYSGEGEPSEEEARLVRVLAGHHHRGEPPALSRQRRGSWQALGLVAAIALVVLSGAGILFGEALLDDEPEPEPEPEPAPVVAPPPEESPTLAEPSGWSFTFTTSYHDYRGRGGRPPDHAAAPPPGTLLHGVLDAAKSGDCALALTRLEEAMEVSPDYVALYEDVAYCMTRPFSRQGSTEADDPMDLGALVHRLSGGEVPAPWSMPAPGGVERLLAEMARPGEDNRFREALYASRGEVNLVGDLGNLLRLEAEAAQALSTLPAEWRTPETDLWWARRVYITRSGLAAWYGQNLSEHHPDLHARVEASLAASLAADPLPEVVVAAAREAVVEFPMRSSKVLVVRFPQYSGRLAALKCGDEQVIRTLEAGRAALPWPEGGECSLHVGGRAEVDGGLRGPGVLRCEQERWNPIECRYVEEGDPWG